MKSHSLYKCRQDARNRGMHEHMHVTTVTAAMTPPPQQQQQAQPKGSNSSCGNGAMSIHRNESTSYASPPRDERSCRCTRDSSLVRQFLR